MFAVPILSSCMGKTSRPAHIAQDVKDTAQPDELIDFHHLKARRGMSQLELEDEVQTDLQRATGLADTSNADSTRLNRILQLTGMHFANVARIQCKTQPVSSSCRFQSWSCWIVQWDADDLQRATGLADTSNAVSTRLNRILQLTGTQRIPCQSCCPLHYLTFNHKQIKDPVNTKRVCILACADRLARAIRKCGSFRQLGWSFKT